MIKIAVDAMGGDNAPYEIVKGAVESVINEYLSYFLEENPAIGRLIVEKGILASRAREAAKRA